MQEVQVPWLAWLESPPGSLGQVPIFSSNPPPSIFAKIKGEKTRIAVSTAKGAVEMINNCTDADFPFIFGIFSILSTWQERQVPSSTNHRMPFKSVTFSLPWGENICLLSDTCYLTAKQSVCMGVLVNPAIRMTRVTLYQPAKKKKNRDNLNL